MTGVVSAKQRLQNQELHPPTPHSRGRTHPRPSMKPMLRNPAASDIPLIKKSLGHEGASRSQTKGQSLLFPQHPDPRFSWLGLERQEMFDCRGKLTDT